MRVRLSKTVVDALVPGDRESIVWDADLIGFGVRVRPSGSMTYIYQYRIGHGRGSPTRKLTLGDVKKITVDVARGKAKKSAAIVANGGDPAQEKTDHRKSPLFPDLFSEYADEMLKKKIHKPRTHELNGYHLRLYIRPRFGNRKAIDVSPSELAELHSSLAHIPIMANRMINSIGAMYRWASKHKKIPPHNPAAEIERYGEEGRERFLTGDEYQRLAQTIELASTVGLTWEPDPSKKVKHAPSEKHRRVMIDPAVLAAIRLFLLTGTRLREILNLRWTDYDRERGVLFVPDSKTGRKTVVLSEAAMEVLDSLPRTGDYIIAGRYPNKPRRDIKRPWNRIRKHAGLDGVRIHDLRHSFASVGVGVGLGLPIIGKLLGHAKTTTTEKYAHLETAPQRRVANVIGERITAAMSLGASSNMFNRTGDENRTEGGCGRRGRCGGVSARRLFLPGFPSDRRSSSMASELVRQ